MKSLNTLNWPKTLLKAFLYGVIAQLALMAIPGLFFFFTGLPVERLTWVLLWIGGILFIPFQWLGLYSVLEDTLEIKHKEGKWVLMTTGTIYGFPSGLIVAIMLSFVLDLSVVSFFLILFCSPFGSSLFGYYVWHRKAYRFMP